MLKSHYKDVFQNQFRHWWYLGMAEINKILLNKYLPKKHNLKILDAGCGPGAMLKVLKSYGEVIGIDLSDEALKYAGTIAKVQKGNIIKTKFKKESFDLIICMDVLYHTWVRDEALALREFARIIKKGGLLLLREPAYDWMRGREDRGSLTARRFSKKRLKKSLTDNGFDVVRMSHANFFLFPAVLIIRLLTMAKIKTGKSDMIFPSKLINSIFVYLLKTEGNLMKYLSLPFGSSLISVSRKV